MRAILCRLEITYTLVHIVFGAGTAVTVRRTMTNSRGVRCAELVSPANESAGAMGGKTATYLPHCSCDVLSMYGFDCDFTYNLRSAQLHE